MRKRLDKVAKNPTFCVQMANLIRELKCGFNFLSERFDITHHAFLNDVGVDLKSLIPIEMSSLFRLFHTFSTPFSFYFLVYFYKVALILILVESSPKP